jgi:hypothetical protein
MTKKNSKLSVVIALSFSLIFMSSTITLVHVTHAQTNTTSGTTGSANAKNSTGIGSAGQLQKFLGNNTAMMQNNSNIGNPNASTTGALKGMGNITKSGTNNASKTTLSNANKTKEGSQPIMSNISQGGKAIGNKAGQLAQAIVNETGKIFGSITGTLNKSSTSNGK